MKKKGVQKPVPTGTCWCDCGGSTAPGSFFLQGHDKRAERYLADARGETSIAHRLAARGYIPETGKSLRDAALASPAGYEACGLNRLDGQPCRVIGRGIGMRKHRADASQHFVKAT